MSKLKSMSVLLVTTWAFTVCFAVWMMFGVTGIPIRTQLGSQFNPIRPPYSDAGADRRAVPASAWHLDRPVRRADHHAAAFDRLRRPALGFVLCDPILAISAARFGAGPGRRLVLGRHSLCRAFLSEGARGFRDGLLWRRHDLALRSICSSRRSSSTTMAGSRCRKFMR